jgi:hypothetical protein
MCKTIQLTGMCMLIVTIIYQTRNIEPYHMMDRATSRTVGVLQDHSRGGSIPSAAQRGVFSPFTTHPRVIFIIELCHTMDRASSRTGGVLRDGEHTDANTLRGSGIGCRSHRGREERVAGAAHTLGPREWLAGIYALSPLEILCLRSV